MWFFLFFFLYIFSPILLQSSSPATPWVVEYLPNYNNVKCQQSELVWSLVSSVECWVPELLGSQQVSPCFTAQTQVCSVTTTLIGTFKIYNCHVYKSKPRTVFRLFLVLRSLFWDGPSARALGNFRGSLIPSNGTAN